MILDYLRRYMPGQCPMLSITILLLACLTLILLRLEIRVDRLQAEIATLQQATPELPEE